MKDVLLIIPSCYRTNDAMLPILKELEKTFKQAAEYFWQDEHNVLELKHLLAGNRFDPIIICFFDLLESNIPEFQLVKSLSFGSRIILFYPDLKLVKQHENGVLEIESEIVKWKISGRRGLLNIFSQSDLVVVSGSEEARLVNEAGGNIKVIAQKDFVRKKYEFPKKIRKKISIIMLTFNQLEDTKNCVESLMKQTPPGYELIFVDNGSTDSTREYLEKLKSENDSVKLIFNETNLGFAKANNQGIRMARGEYILLLNNDVILTENWLGRLVACIESDKTIGVVGPCTNKAVGQQVVEIPLRFNDRDIARAASVQLLKNAGCWSEVHRIIGFCMLIKREVIDKIGMLDEQFGPGGFEDYDYCLRVKQAGYKIMIANDVFIYHLGGRGYSGNNLDYDKLRAHNVQLFIGKWCRKALEVLEIL